MTENDRDRLAYALQPYDTDRKHRKHILTVTNDAKEHQMREDDPLLEVLRRAHLAKAEEADQQ